MMEMLARIGIKKEDGYKKLLNEIFSTDAEEDNYSPKDYSFNLDSFNEEGNQKK